MTTTETNQDTKQEWAGAIAQANEPGDPPPKKFRARLTCTLSDRELVDHGRKYADAEQELEDFDAETKQMAQERKATRAEILGRKQKHRKILSTGREDRDIDCIEYVSIRQGRKWRVRLDTKEQYEEGPLSDSERQGTLPIDDKQLDLPTEESDPTDVNDPEALLDAAGADDESDDIDADDEN